ncbi:protein of unknown function UPF0066 [Methanosalsum zhilinae DSM 4017]|uniref:TsaA-like domain-containing protein n=1 Tax=Methanosalsum zhilinae (strain DSM 4017 / NBRC 107636 / OCM 62 / WeN5) TaxID=679901 RepID=F7XLL5_METZD|nr:tRNA (N6-threonylcarbamoyladenosine(37)-N6)-methyltransferase TrmO [Methanosalsum zhilinae]AEH60834.1 protein of unknown function UPF0066 [Methanosalsum zhilinae DSM 4017]
MNVQIIGSVINEFQEPVDPDIMRESVSKILIKPEFEDGLYKIEDNDYIQIIFFFDRSEGYELIGKRRHGGIKGVFASRSPMRPTPIGTSVVKLLSRNTRELEVKGLDALNQTPIIDIKPYAKPFDSK